MSVMMCSVKMDFGQCWQRKLSEFKQQLLHVHTRHEGTNSTRRTHKVGLMAHIEIILTMVSCHNESFTYGRGYLIGIARTSRAGNRDFGSRSSQTNDF